MTFSIVAFDPETGEVGVAVQSKAFAVGSLVPWAKAGVGAVATQSLVNISLGPKGIELMETGRKPEQILDHFRTIDTGIERRQLGIISVKHGAYSFTGEECIGWAGGRVGENYACQGNILTGNEVVDAMADAFEKYQGNLAERLLAALSAAQKAGGDSRGKQSACLIIEHEGKGRAGYGSRKIDLRVEDHDDPISELSRVYEIQKMNETIVNAFVKSTENKEEAIEYLTSAIAGRMDRTMDEAWLSLALLYYVCEDHDKARETLDTCMEINPGMINIFRHYPTLGIGFDEEFVDNYLKNR